MRVRNKNTGEVSELGVLPLLLGLLAGRIRTSKYKYERPDTIRGGKKPARNKPCPYCASGLKFKRCCGDSPQQKQHRLDAAARLSGDQYRTYA